MPCVALHCSIAGRWRVSTSPSGSRSFVSQPVANTIPGPEAQASNWSRSAECTSPRLLIEVWGCVLSEDAVAQANASTSVSTCPVLTRSSDPPAGSLRTGAPRCRLRRDQANVSQQIQVQVASIHGQAVNMSVPNELAISVLCSVTGPNDTDTCCSLVHVIVSRAM